MIFTSSLELIVKQILKHMLAFIITHVSVYYPLRGKKKMQCCAIKYNNLNTKLHYLQCFTCESKKIVPMIKCAVDNEICCHHV